MSDPEYYEIFRHYEGRFDQYGATAKGMDWPNERDLARRFEVMLGIVRSGDERPVSLVDLGCGAGLLVDHLRSKGVLDAFEYHGIDISAKMVAAGLERYPQLQFEVRDVLVSPLPPRSVDYIIMNGVLTEKLKLTRMRWNISRGVLSNRPSSRVAANSL
jgi:predicted TPR repeat methyltransferase